MKTNGVRCMRVWPSTVSVTVIIGQRRSARRAAQGEGRPLAEAEPLLLMLAVAHQVDVQAEAGIVQEMAVADLADVDLDGMSGGDRLQRGRQFQRNAEVLREMVQRAERQHAEGHRLADQRRRHRVERAVAAAGHHRRAAVVERPAHRIADLVAVLHPADRAAGGDGLDGRAVVGQPVVVVAAGLAVEDECDASMGHGGWPGRRRDDPCCGGARYRQTKSQAPPSSSAARQSLG